jgi:sugar phosphate isomerase/epimerase
MRVGDKYKMHMFLNGVNKLIKDTQVSFCVEPNAKFYGAEYYNTVSEIFNDLDKYENISTMIDVGNSILEDQDIFSEYDSYQDKVCHVHFANKGLKPIEDFNLYKDFIVNLKENGYKGMVSYEFASSDDIPETIKTFSEKIIQNV